MTATKKLSLNPEAMPVTGNTPKTRPENRAFYPALDGLRAVAFLLVFFQHYASFPWGWSGVNIFFVLSGFLITGILFDSRNDPHRARNFYVRRTLRIFPLYYFIIFVTVISFPLAHWKWSLYWLAWPAYLANFLPFISHAVTTSGGPLQLAAYAWLRPAAIPLFTLFLGHFWSLCVEEQFYFLWPWIVFFVPSKRVLIWICSAAVVFVPLLRVLAQHYAPEWMLDAGLLDRATPFQVDSLLLGGLVALMLRGKHTNLLFFVGKITAFCAGIVISLALVPAILRSFPAWGTNYVYPAWEFTWGLSFINLFAAALIVCALRPSGFLFRVLSISPLRWMGRISYGAYIYHGIPAEIYRGTTVGFAHRYTLIGDHFTLFKCLFALFCTLAISWLSFEYLESTFLNLKERWTVSAATATSPEIEKASMPSHH